MIDGLKPYLEYYESKQAQLGLVPSTWRLDRLKNWVAINPRVLQEGTDGDFLFSYLDIGSVGTGFLAKRPEKIRFRSAPSRARRLLQSGDTIVSTVRTYLKAVLTYDGSIDPAVASTGFAVLKPKEQTVPFFVGYFAQSDRFTNQVMAESIGITYPAISETNLGNLAVVIPPHDEQTAIVRFLDHANGRIEQAIRAKKMLMALLNEQKQTIIHRAVTRGLNPNTAFKPSGLPWLGDIPKHWEVSRSKYVFREVDDRSATGKELRLSMCQKRGLIPSSEIEVKRLVSESAVSAKICEAGDLVLNRLKAHLGVFALASVRGLVSPDYTILRPARAMCPRYFELIYRTPACRVELRKRAKGIVQGFWRLYTDDFYDIRVPVPPVPEQEKIVKQLDSDLATLNTALARTEREIGLLREYRTRLVADVVTGKLDVRVAASHLPAEPEIPPNLIESDELTDEAETDETTETTQ